MIHFNRDFQNEIQSKQEDAIHFYMLQICLKTIEMVGGGEGEYIHFIFLESIFVSSC